MKKILLLVATVSCAVSLNSQIMFSDDFESGTPFLDGWLSLDADGDGDYWQVIDFSTFGPPFNVNGYVGLSASQQGATARTPDNLLISPAFSLSGVTGPLELRFKAGSESTTASGDYAEYFSVYVLPDNTAASVMTATPVFSGNLTSGMTMINYTLDITAQGGSATSYVVFRHHNCTGLNDILIDAIEVEQFTLGTNILGGNDIQVYPNPTTDYLNYKISGDEISSYMIYSLDGKKLIEKNVANSELIDMTSLTQGMYFVEIHTVSGKVSKSTVEKK